MSSRRRRIVAIICDVVMFAGFMMNGSVVASDTPGATPPAVDFSRDVRPILSQHCWKCHGADEASRKGKLRLDDRDVAVARKAIVPGDVGSSKLLKRINSSDEDEQMPPPKAKLALNAGQKQVLRDWIGQGAKFSQHWAYIAPNRPDVPNVAVLSWARGAIDRFVLHRLEQEKLRPSPEADRATLIRRLCLDLTGLPPSEEDLAAFLADEASDAYERTVDRLLASPRYGERMALVWLDAARYADTNGYNNDEDRIMWPWRDWVIDAFNQDMRYDRFIVEQLAGDLLPHPTLSQQIATAFHRNQGHNTEGGIIQEEYRVEYVADRVHTTATIFLGLSMQCARCHDHKYDPISQKDYYRFFAFFNNVDEKQASYSNFTAAEPFIKIPTTDQQAKIAALQTERSELEAKIAQRTADADAGLARWEQAHSGDEIAKLQDNALLHRFALNEKEGTAVHDTADPSRSASPAGTIKGKAKWVAGKFDGALEFDGQTFVDAGPIAGFDGSGPFSVSAWVRPTSMEAMAVLSRMDEGNASRGYDVLIDASKINCHLIHHWNDNAIKVICKRSLALNTWQHILVTYDGSGTAAGVKLYVDGKPEAVDVANDALKGTIATEKPLHIGRRENSLSFKGALDEIQIFGRALGADDAVRVAGGQAPSNGAGEALRVAAKDRTDAQRSLLRQFYLDRLDLEYPKLKAALADRERQKQELEKAGIPLMVMKEMATPRECFVLKRGQYDQPGERVTADVPAAVLPMSPDLPHNRLGLARWLVDPKNPLTARVAVNRWWQMYFGTGLVKTAEDLGVTGEFPSHPELLDYLATELIASGWDVKAMQKAIVMSATYRQSSRASAEQMDRDPENRLLARGPRFRLPAEAVRDNALAISGLLRERVGGPSVKPYQPEGLWEDVTVERRGKYVADKGEGLYRRSLYTFWKRTCPPPALMNFDAPLREVCLARRSRTNTPLQSLVLTNDPTYVEAARKLAERMVKEGGGRPDECVTAAYRIALARTPSDAERKIILGIYQEALAMYQGDKPAAIKLLSVGDSPRDAADDPAELAAYTVVASTILNLDETISKR